MTLKQKVLVVDDTPANIHVLAQTLRGDYTVVAATSGHKALALAVKEPLPDIILLDVMMPDLDGYDVCARLKDDALTVNIPVIKDDALTVNIPVIFVTALSEAGDEARGLELGAVDYITKPINPSLVKARVRNQLELKRHRDHLQELVDERTRQLKLTQAVTIEALGALAEYRDPETGGHIRRTQHYVRLLAQRMRQNPKFAALLDQQTVEWLYLSAPLHDIGKVGIRDNILLKPGKLTYEEFEDMKKHAGFGRDAIKSAESRLGGDSFLRYAREIAETHHEKWNGSGYPRGLKQDEIPLSGRLMAVADVYDALISKRVYKAPLPHSEAVRLIVEGSGSHFDPDVVDAFLGLQEEFRQIALRFADFPEEKQMLEDV